MKATARSNKVAAPVKAAVRPRTKPSDVRRKDLMKAGERLFLRKGVGATSVDDIVAAADVAKGTFYLYFPSKQELLAALQERFVEDLVAAVRARTAVLGAGDWLARLDAWADGGVTFYLDKFRLHDVLFHSGGAPSGAYGFPVKLIAELTGLLRAGAEAGAWNVADPEMTAVCLYHAMHGGLDFAAMRQDKPDRVALIAAVADFYRRVVRPV